MMCVASDFNDWLIKGSYFEVNVNDVLPFRKRKVLGFRATANVYGQLTL